MVVIDYEEAAADLLGPYVFFSNFVANPRAGAGGGSFPCDLGGYGSRRKTFYTHGRRRKNRRAVAAVSEDAIRRTVFVPGVWQMITEQDLAALFLICGQIVDCRISGVPGSCFNLAFIEFNNEEGARSALDLAGTVLGYFPIRVLPSKTAIEPVDLKLLPNSEDEREMCSRTIYCTNIDTEVTRKELKFFFETVCGEVQRLRFLGGYNHTSGIAFVEFAKADGARVALYCSGSLLGSLPLRISPSKTPVRQPGP